MLSVGAATPSLRLDAGDVAAAWGKPGGRGQAAVCGADEDVLTLAWEAGRQALRNASLDPATVGGLWWGTSRPPFGEGPSLAYLASALHLGERTDGSLISGAPTAGLEAVLAAADALVAGRVTTALVIAADDLQPALGTAYERRAGAAAAAFVLTSDGPGTASLAQRASLLRPVLDRYRGRDDAATRDVYDGRLFREQVFLPAVTDVAGRLGDAGEVNNWSLPDPDGKLGRAVAKKLGVESHAATISDALGDVGAAAAPLGLINALTGPGTTAAIAHGGGRTIGLTVESDAEVPGARELADELRRGRPSSYTEVLRARGRLTPDTERTAMALPPGSAAFVRGNEELLGLHGARCVDCETISTPPSVHPTCTGCGGNKLETVPLATSGTIQTFVVNQTMPPPFEAPLPLVVVDLDDGARLILQGVSDYAAPAIGHRIELRLRRYSIERGAPVYGYKVAPATTAADTNAREPR